MDGFKPLEPNFRVDGEDIYLRSISENDAELILSWRNSDFVASKFFYRLPLSMDEELAWIHGKVETGEVFQFIVYTKDTDTPIGSVYLQHFDEVENSMEYGIFMSEDMPEGKSYGTQALRTLTYEFAFKYLNLSSTCGIIIKDNTASRRVAEKTGYIVTGECIRNTVPDNVPIEAVTVRHNRPAK